MSDVEFYRDHIDGLRQQLLLRDRKIEQLEKAVTRGVRMRADVEKIQQRLISLNWNIETLSPHHQPLCEIINDLMQVLRGEQ